MNTVKLYKNPKHYPHYTHTITQHGPDYYATPRNMDLKSGFIDLQCTFADVMSCNYLSFTRDGQTVFGWITNVEERSGNLLYRFHYEVDPFRTYRTKLNLDNQFITRSPEPTELFDPFLGSTQPHNDISQVTYSFGDASKRVLVVQVKRASGDGVSNVPLNPSPNNFYVREYDINNWANDTAIQALMLEMAGAQPDRIVTMYSVPYFDWTGLASGGGLPVRTGGSTISGFRFIDFGSMTRDRVTTQRKITIPPGLTKTAHSVMVVIPDAGIISIPDELLYVPDLALRMDVDIFSGACNYMLVDGNGKPFHLSSRGSSVSSIPVVGDPMETYLSQNQNALTVSMLGDVASVVAGGAMVATGGGALIGGGLLTKGITGMAGTFANVQDAGKQQTNPPAYLGTALAPHFNRQFWVVTIKTHVTNQALVNSEIGYPCNILKPLALPASGYIQTQGCAVKSNGTVPQWALQEINRLFDAGIKVE